MEIFFSKMMRQITLAVVALLVIFSSVEAFSSRIASRAQTRALVSFALRDTVLLQFL